MNVNTFSSKVLSFDQEIIIKLSLFLIRSNYLELTNPSKNEWLDNFFISSVYESIPEWNVMFSESALIGMKAVKNEVEADGMMTSHVRDAVALAEFFSHLEQDVSNEKKNYTELSAADLVRHFAS